MPEIVTLAFKALGKCVYGATEKASNLQQHMNLIQASVNDLQISKASKRELDRHIEDTKFMMERGNTNSEEDRSASVDYKFRREEGLDRTMIEEVKTIALALIEERIATFGDNEGEKLHDILDKAIYSIRKEVSESIQKISAQATPKEPKSTESPQILHVATAPARPWELEREKLND